MSECLDPKNCGLAGCLYPDCCMPKAAEPPVWCGGCGYHVEGGLCGNDTPCTSPCAHAREVCRRGDTYCADCGELL